MRTFSILYSDNDGENWDWLIRAPDVEIAYAIWMQTTGIDWTELDVQPPGTNISTMSSIDIARHAGRIMDITDINKLPIGPVEWEMLPIVAWIND